MELKKQFKELYNDIKNNAIDNIRIQYAGRKFEEGEPDLFLSIIQLVGYDEFKYFVDDVEVFIREQNGSFDDFYIQLQKSIRQADLSYRILAEPTNLPKIKKEPNAEEKTLSVGRRLKNDKLSRDIGLWEIYRNTNGVIDSIVYNYLYTSEFAYSVFKHFYHNVFTASSKFSLPE